MSVSRKFVIVGAGLAGAKAAETLRKEGFEGEIVLIGEEPVRPYERPPLSKDYLQGKSDVEKAFVHPEAFYADQAIELHTSTRVRELDAASHEIILDSGERVAYDSLLLTTGARSRRLSVPGADLAGLYYLRDLADSDRLRAAISGATKVVVIGAGWIGCEVAASARQLGAEVAMIESAPLPLVRVLGDELGAFYRDVHADHGVELHFGLGVESLQGNGQVEGVRLADGSTVQGDVIVAGVGAALRIELAEAAGLAIDNGVLTNEFLVTSNDRIFAAGDIANALHPLFGQRIRLEHWSSALNQGQAAARNMLGAAKPYVRVPYFYSDQYDVGMEYSGFAPHWDQVVFRGDPRTRQFIAFWLDQGRLVAGMNVNIWDVNPTISALVAQRQHIDHSQLADPDFDLSGLVEPDARPAD